MKELSIGVAAPVNSQKANMRRQTRNHLQRKKARRWTAYSTDQERLRVTWARLEQLEATDYNELNDGEQDANDDDDYDEVSVPARFYID